MTSLAIGMPLPAGRGCAGRGESITEAINHISCSRDAACGHKTCRFAISRGRRSLFAWSPSPGAFMSSFTHCQECGRRLTDVRLLPEVRGVVLLHRLPDRRAWAGTLARCCDFGNDVAIQPVQRTRHPWPWVLWPDSTFKGLVSESGPTLSGSRRQGNPGQPEVPSGGPGPPA